MVPHLEDNAEASILEQAQQSFHTCALMQTMPIDT